MKKFFFLIFAVLAISSTMAQISGTKTIPGDYATIRAAIDDMNNQGVGGSGVTFNVAAGYIETITDSLVLKASGRAGGLIIFQKSGTGDNPVIRRTNAGSQATTLLGANGDAVMIFQACDYVKFDAIDIATDNQGIEYGYLIRKDGQTNGCVNVTINNCKVALTKGTSAYVVGIYVSNLVSDSPLNNADGITPQSTEGIHDGITLTRNIIENVSTGILARGYNHTVSPYNLFDRNLTIGGVDAGNTIRNYAASTTGTHYGIYTYAQQNLNVSYNNINNTGGGGTPATGTIYGVYNVTGTTCTLAANNNTLTMTTLSSTLYGIYNTTTGALNISSNTFEFNTQNSGTGQLHYIYNTGVTPLTIISYNTFVGTSVKTTGDINFIYNSNSQLTPAVTNVQANSVSGNWIRDAASGTTRFYYNGASPTGTENFFDNNFSNITTSGTAVTYGYYSSTAAAHTQNVYGNVFSNWNTGSGTVYPIYAALAGTKNIFGNQVFNITSAATTFHGINAASGNATTHIRQNNVYNLTTTSNSTSAVLYGISVSSGTNVNIYNNFVSNLNAPSGAATATGTRNTISGIYITASTNANVYFNTVFLNASSTGANFGTSGIYCGVSTTSLDLRNNIIVNKSTRSGTGFTVALRRGGAFASTNYALTSNGNDLMVPETPPGYYLYWDGTTGNAGKDSTIAAFKSRVGPRDGNSFTEDPPFVNDTAAPYNLHLQAGVQSKCESGGVSVTSPIDITNDFDGEARYPDPLAPIWQGFPPSAVDVGADEFAGKPSFNCETPVPGYTYVTNDTICLGESVTFTIQGPINGTGNSYQWQISTDNAVFTDIPDATGVSYTVVPTFVAWYRCMVTCQNGPVSVPSVPEYVTFHHLVLTTQDGERCGPGTAKLEATVDGGILNWYDVPSGGAPVGTGSPFFTPFMDNTTTYYAAAEELFPGTITIGAGATTSTTYPNPFYSLWSNTHNQHLIRATDLISAGLSSGDLTALGLTITSPGTLPMIDFSLKLGLTTVNALSDFISPAFTTVYTNASLMPVNGVNMMTFTTPFYWDGVSNLVIEICHGNGSSSATMSRTCLVDNTSYVSTVHTQISAATAAAVSCANTTTNKVTYSIMPQWKINGVTVCSSPRTPVTATVTPAPPLTITESAAICINEVKALAVTSNTSLFDNYIWSPVTNLFSDAACTVPYAGESAVTVYCKAAAAVSTTYTCWASSNTTFCANYDEVDITVLPNTATITADPEYLCIAGSSILTASSPEGFGNATFQWQESVEGISYYDIQGATNVSYTSPYIGMTTYYRFIAKNSQGQACLSTDFMLDVHNPLVTNTVPGFSCGPGIVTLGATGTTGQLTWFASPTGGTPVGTGNTFTTPYLWASKTYYVSALEPGTILESGGKPNPPGTTAGTTQNWGMVFTANDDFFLQSVDVFPTGATGGQIGISLYSSTQQLLAGPFFFNFPVGNGATPYTIPLNLPIEAGTGYRLLATTLTGGSLVRESSGVTYPISNGTLVSMTSAATSLTGTSTTTYNYFYNWRVLQGCASPLTPVLATINLAPVYEVTFPQAVCNNEVAKVEVWNGTLYYDSLTWSPDSILFTDVACTTPYVAGTSVPAVYMKTTIPGYYEIRGYASNNTNGCSNFDTTSVVVLPTELSIESDYDTICIIGSANLSLVPAMNYGAAKIQWQISSNNVTFTNIPGATNSTYNTGDLIATTYYRVTIQNSSLIECLSAQRGIYVDSPAITGTTGAERCGTGTVTLTATATPGTTINWYGALAGGAILGTGGTFTTPPINTTTTYYVSATGPSGSTGVVGPPTRGSTGTYTLLAGLYFDVYAPSLIIEGVYIYPVGTGAGVVNIALQNSANTELQALSFECTGTASPGVKTYVPLNWTVQAGTNYSLVMTSRTGLVASLIRDVSTSIIGGPIATNPYCDLPGKMKITNGRLTNSSGTSYYYFFDWQVRTGCVSDRVPVVATVFPSNPVNITPDRTICPNQIHTLSVTSALGDYDVYTWSPVDNLYTDAAATLPYQPLMNRTTVYVKSPTGGSTKYICNANNTSSLCNDTASSTVTVLPDAIINAVPAEICVAGKSTMSLIPATGYGLATFQWQISSDSIVFTNITGATNQTYTSDTLTETRWFKVIVKNAMGDICSEPVVKVYVNNPEILSIVPGERCGPGTVQLEAVASEGTTIRWYESSEGGQPIATGPTFTTPILGLTTSYFVAAVGGDGGSSYVGRENVESNASNGGGLSSYMDFTVHKNTILQTVDVFPYGTGAGTLTVQLRTSTGTVLMSKTFNVTGATPATNSQRHTLELNFPVEAGQSYRLGVGAWTGGVTNLYRDDAGSSVNYPYPYSIPGVVDITGNNLSLRYWYFFYKWQFNTDCESPRQEVLATVAQAPELIISDSKTICIGEIYPLSVNSPLIQYETFTWSPATNLFTDAACTVPYVAGTSASTVYVKAASGSITPYVCKGSNSTGMMCENYDTAVVTVIPAAAIVSQPEAICFIGRATLSLEPATGYGAATFQWFISPDGTSYTEISGATNQSYLTDTLEVSTYYKVNITNGSATVCTSPVYLMEVSEPAISSTTPGSRCGVGTVNLGATGTGGTVQWFAAPSGGEILGSGDNFTTPVISTTTNFYAAVAAPGSMDGNVGMEQSINGTSGSGKVTYGLYFDALAPFTLKQVNVYPNAAANNTPGTVTISVIDTAGTILHQAVVDVVGYVQSSNPNMQTVDLNFNIEPENNLRLVMQAMSSGISGLMFQPSSQAPYPYPYVLAGVVSITSGTYSNSVKPDLYYYFYNWKVSQGCSSARTAVAATVTAPPAMTVTATPDTICAGTESILNVTSDNAGYTYAWMPGSLNGATQTVSPESTTQYTVTASDAGSGCVNVASVTVALLPTPTPITIAPAAPVINAGDIQMLTASGGTLAMNGVLGTGTSVNSTTGYPAPYSNYYGGTKHQMLIRAGELTAAGLYPGAPINSISFNATAFGTTFDGYLAAFRIDMGLTTTTALTSTAFLGGLTNVLPADTINPVIGQNTHMLTTPFVWDGTSNLVIQTSYSNANAGTSTDFVQMTNSDPGFVSTNWYRVDSKSAAEVLAAATPTSSGNARPNMILGFAGSIAMVWTPQSDLYTDAAATIPYTGQSLATVYTKPFTSKTYTVTATNSLNGCNRTGSVTVEVISNCPIPGNVIVTNIASTSATVGWSEPPSPPGSGYEYEIRTSGNPGDPVGYVLSGSVMAGVTSAGISGLAPNTNYHAYVRSNCGDDVYSQWTTDYPFTTLNVPPLGVTAVVTNSTCPEACDGAIITTVTGGVAPYGYSWSNGSSSASLTGLCPGIYFVTVTDAASATATGSWEVGITNPICDNITVAGIVDGIECFNALNTITVAGPPSTFTVTPTGDATFIAGMKIIFLPGTTVQPGGYLHGYIAPSGPFCGAAKLTEVTAKTEAPVATERTWFTLFPNPTSGNFTLVMKGEQAYNEVRIEVYGMNGERVLTENMIGAKHEFRFSGIPVGLYFVKVVADEYVETIKLVKTR